MSDDLKLEVWKTLSEIDVSNYVKNKNGLTYLSWTWAWGIVKKHYPDASYKVLKNQDNLPFFKSEQGIICYTSVTVCGLTYEMWLPVMNSSNKAMKDKPYTYQVDEWEKGKKTGNKIDKTVEAADMFNINKTIMRCLTKNIAMFGLGHYIYCGEDLPDEDISAPKPAFTEEEKVKFDKYLYDGTDIEFSGFCDVIRLDTNKYIALYNSFPNDKVKNKQLVDEKCKSGKRQADEYVEEIIKLLCDKNDVDGAKQLWSELTVVEQGVLRKQLGDYAEQLK